MHLFQVPAVEDILAVALMLLLCAAAPAQAQLTAYPSDPVNPQRTAQCHQLAQEYDGMIAMLLKRHDAIGRGRGRQVLAGQCCLKHGNHDWCTTFESHAATWEALNCAEWRRQSSIDRCLAKVRQARHQGRGQSGTSPRQSIPALDERTLDAAEKLIDLRRRIDLAVSWTQAGNDPTRISELTQRTAGEATDAIHDEVIRDHVAQNLEDIGVTFDRVMQSFEQTSERAASLFPNAGVRASPSQSQLSRSPGRLMDGACGDRVARNIDACLQAEIDKQKANLTDFSFYQRCKDRFAAELAECR